MKARLTGPLGDLMRRHLQLRRSLGYLLGKDELTLDQFDAYIGGHFPGATVVTRAMVTGYLKTIEDRHPVTRRHQLSTLRQFGRFLFQMNPETYIPEPHLLPPAKSQLQPHLYSLDEVRARMTLARRLPPAGSLRPQTYATLVGLF